MSAGTRPPAALFRGGVVRTGDPAAPAASALGVRDGRVVAVGAEADVRSALEGCDVDAVDLDGGALLPGFRDGHAHPLWGGVELAGPQVRDLESVEAVVAAVRAYADAHPTAPWVVGGPYSPTLAPGGLFDARWLDAAVADRPVLLESSDHHCAWVNTAALRAAGVDEHTPDPPSGQVARRDDGSPLGTLLEWTAMDLVKQHAPEPSERERRDGLATSTALLRAAGIVWVQEASASVADAATYLALAEEGRLAVRCGVALRADPGRWPAERAAFSDLRTRSGQNPWVRVSTVKLFVDGCIEVGTAALSQPYADQPHSCGLPVWEPRELVEAMCAFDADGFQLHLHAIGDAAIRLALDGIEEVARRNGVRDRRPVLAHVQLVDPADVPRFAELGVIASFQPLWAQLDDFQTQLTGPRIGPERSARQYPIGTLAAAGAVLAFGSDWPVSSYDPLEGAATAVTRQDADGRPPGGWLPAERLPPEVALAAYTTGTAYQAFEAPGRGTLLPGSWADAVWLSEDPYAVPARRWAGVEVRGTWVQSVASSAARVTVP